MKNDLKEIAKELALGVSATIGICLLTYALIVLTLSY